MQHRVKNLTIWQHPINGSYHFLAWHINFSRMLKNLSGLQGLRIGDYQDIFPYLQLAHMNVSVSIQAPNSELNCSWFPVVKALLP